MMTYSTHADALADLVRLNGELRRMVDRDLIRDSTISSRCSVQVVNEEGTVLHENKAAGEDFAGLIRVDHQAGVYHPADLLDRISVAIDAVHRFEVSETC